MREPAARVEQGLTIGVLSPLLGGFYFGGLISGIGAAAREAGGRVIALQTFDPGLPEAAYQETTDFRHPVAWSHVAGLIVILNAVNREYLMAIRDAGTPVVLVSQESPDLECPVMLADSRSGVREAVEHLVWHGHRRIAFAGHLTQYDLRERYESYVETLVSEGISPDPALVYEAPDNLVSGGQVAGRSMVAAGLPSTALIAGTDLNAIGIMEILTEAGYRVPGDQAIVGFDDTAAATHVTPTLSSVRQDFDELGRRAATLLLDVLNGRDAQPRRHYMPTSFIPRESCGCPPNAPSATGEGPAEVCRSHVRELNAESSYFQELLSAQYEVSMELLHSHIKNPRSLDWLQRTSAHAGCLGLWTSRPHPHEPTPASAGDARARRALDVVGVFDGRWEGQQSLSTPTTTVDNFPPSEFIHLVDEDPNDVVLVVPVRVRSSDWGLLAVIGSVDQRMGSGKETINQWAALLSVALDHEAMLESLRQQEESMRRAALYDPLTDLPNRVLFHDRVRQAIAKCQRRPDYEFAVLFIDLDGFKVVNDSLGHMAGDQLLVRVADRIKADLRRNDVAARLGGDEFAILVDDVGGSHVAEPVAERLQSVLSRPFRLAGQDIVVSASIGIASNARSYRNADDVLRDADIAMYNAKSKSKGTHATFRVGMRNLAVSRLRTEADLRRALIDDEFELHYQPIVDLASGGITSLEALIRWRHPTRGLLHPQHFLAVAEEVGLTLPMGRWTVAEVCRQLREWTDDGVGPADLTVNVNISNKQFWQSQLLHDVRTCLAATELTPDRLALEITESVIMYNAKAARRMLSDLHKAGLTLHIDDFGTGYSSLGALLQLPIHALKMDRSFISRMEADPRSRELVRTMIVMAANLGLQVVAEGIETAAQHEMLRQFGCEYGQGFLFSEPVPGPRATTLLSQSPIAQTPSRPRR